MYANLALMGGLMKVSGLAPNPQNPRVVSDAKLAQLKKSLLEFGDLSGIVFNRKTGHIVGGHQRTKQLDADAVVTLTQKYKKPTKTGTVAEGYVLLDGERFSYREVAWTKHREMAANLAANKGAGKWDDEKLSEWVKELGSFDVDFDLSLTMFDESELEPLLADRIHVREHDRGDKTAEEKPQHLVIVECKSAKEAERVYNELTTRSFNCKRM